MITHGHDKAASFRYGTGGAAGVTVTIRVMRHPSKEGPYRQREETES